MATRASAASALIDIAAQLPDGRVLAGAAGERRRHVWNGVIDHTPALIVRPETVEEVAAVVSATRRHGLSISVLGGGHDWQGRAMRHDAVVIDLGAMNSVEIAGDSAWIGGGATADDVLSAVGERGMAAALGTTGTVGVVGLISGGGYGPLIGVAGLGIDSLLSAQVVLADGSTVIADHDREPELFWALRGGGANFGVVTRVALRLYPAAEVVAGTIAFSLAHARQVFGGLRQLHAGLDDALTVDWGAMHSPAGPVVFTNPVWSGAPEAADAQIGCVRALGEPVADDIGVRRLADLARATAEAFPAGVRYHLGSRLVAEIDDALIALLIASTDAMPPTCALNVHYSHGAATRVPVDATAYAYRDPHLVIEILGMWTDGDGSAERDWVRATERRLDPVALPGGWANLMAADDPRARDAYGPNTSRLRAAKARYDPDNFFTAIPLP